MVRPMFAGEFSRPLLRSYVLLDFDQSQCLLLLTHSSPARASTACVEASQSTTSHVIDEDWLPCRGTKVATAYAFT
jgi:hypothetical protein